MRKTCLFLLAVLALATSAPAMPCHCFSEKTYDPLQPEAADPYFLATAQNSFFASTFSMSKKKVVFAKQKPASTAEGLWVAYWIAWKTGGDPAPILRSRYRNGSWKTALDAMKLDPGRLGEPFSDLLAKASDDLRLSRFVVDDILSSRKMAKNTDLNLLREMGATDQETILASLLALKTGRQADKFFQAVKNGEATWGTLLPHAGIDGGNMVDEIERLL
jgi:hypothetical protein